MGLKGCSLAESRRSLIGMVRLIRREAMIQTSNYTSKRNMKKYFSVDLLSTHFCQRNLRVKKIAMLLQHVFIDVTYKMFLKHYSYILQLFIKQSFFKLCCSVSALSYRPLHSGIKLILTT